MTGPDIVQINHDNPDLFQAVASLSDKLDLLTRRVGLPTGRYIEFTAVANATTGVQLVDTNYERRYIIFFNNSAGDVFIHNRRQNANDVGRWIKIPTGGFFEPLFVPVEAWYVLGTIANQEVFGYEGI